MSSFKYYERLLIVVGIFLVFFAITVISVPLIVTISPINAGSREGLLLISTFQALVLFIAPSLVTARVISRQPIRYLHLNRKPSWLSVIGVIFAYLIAIPALNQIIYWNANISFPETMAYWGEVMKEMEDKANLSASLMLNVESFGAMLVNLLIVALLTAFGEELFFRGTLQHTAASSGAYFTSIWVVALIFSAMHFQIFGFIPRLLLGAWFGYLLYWTKCIYVPVLAHFINNGVVVVCTWLSAKGMTFNFEMFGVTEYGFPLPAFISALAFIIFIVYFKNFFFTKESYSKKEALIQS